MEIFDSHAHYDDPAFDADREELLGHLPDSGVVGVVNACTSVESCLALLRLVPRYPYLYCAMGIHPENAAQAVPGDLVKIAQLAQEGKADPRGKVVAIGEIGLDYHYEPTDRERQLLLFEEQLKIAQELGLPVIVHDRDANADTLRLLGKYRPRGVVHCYSGSAEMAKEIAALGMYFGFTGSVTFKNNKKAAGVIAAVPFERVLVETDCPYMAPEPLRGRRCDSSMLIHTITRVAEIAGLTPDEAAARTAANARELFDIHS